MTQKYHRYNRHEIDEALRLYQFGLSAKRAAQLVCPGSDKAWVLKNARIQGLQIRTPPETRRLWDPGFDGKTIREGYVLVHKPDHPRSDCWGKVREHILVWDQAHPNDPVKTGEIIHHKNGNKMDNRPENLEKMSRGEHRKYLPRCDYRNGRAKVAAVGEKEAVRFGITLNPLDIGPDGYDSNGLIEIKTRMKRNAEGSGWGFLCDKKTKTYLFVGIGYDYKPIAIWRIPACIVGKRKNMSLSPNEMRKRGKDPYAQYRIALS